MKTLSFYFIPLPINQSVIFIHLYFIHSFYFSLFLFFRDKSQPAIDDAGFLSLIFMSWATPVIKQGFKKSLQIADLDKLSPYESADYNFQRINRLWHEEVKQKGHKDASLARVVFRSIRTRAIVGVVFFLLCQVVTFLSPVRILYLTERMLPSSSIIDIDRTFVIAVYLFTRDRMFDHPFILQALFIFSILQYLESKNSSSVGTGIAWVWYIHCSTLHPTV